MTDAVEIPIGAVEGRPGVTVVTQENFGDYVNQQLGTPNADPEAAAQAEFEALEAAKEAEAAKTAEKPPEPKEGDIDGSKVYFKGKWVSKHDFGYRVHLKTEEARAETKAENERLAQEAKTAKEAAEKAARERDELKAKYEPPPKLEVGPEPDPAKYTDMEQFKTDLKKWAVDKARADDAKAAAEAKAKNDREAQAKRWAETQASIPDYAERLAKAPGAEIGVSEELKTAILDSDVGPQLRLHLAENPDELKEILGLTIGQMLKRVGKLEDKLAAQKIEAKTDQKEQKTTLAEVQISKAPAPISPIKGGNVPAGAGNVLDAQGNVVSGYEAYKAARLAGKIK